jgi:hypothetical protein
MQSSKQLLPINPSGESLVSQLYNAMLRQNETEVRGLFEKVTPNVTEKTRSVFANLVANGEINTIFWMNKKLIDFFSSQQVIMGFAEANDVRSVNAILATVKKLSVRHQLDHLASAIKGYARTTNDTELTNVYNAALKLIPGSGKTDLYLKSSKANGYSLANKVTECRMLMSTTPEVTREISTGLAVCGNLDEVTQIQLKLQGQENVRKNICLSIAYGLAKGGHATKLTKFLKGMPNDWSKELIRQGHYGAAASNFTLDLSSVLTGLNSEMRLVVIQGFITSYLSNGYYGSAKEVLAYAQDDYEREMLLRHMIISLVESFQYYTYSSQLITETPEIHEKKIIVKYIINSLNKIGRTDLISSVEERIFDLPHELKEKVDKYVEIENFVSLQKFLDTHKDPHIRHRIIVASADAFFTKNKTEKLIKLSPNLSAEEMEVFYDFCSAQLFRLKQYKSLIKMINNMAKSKYNDDLRKRFIYKFGFLNLTAEASELFGTNFTKIAPSSMPIVSSLIDGLADGNFIHSLVNMYDARPEIELKKMVAFRLIPILSKDKNPDIAHICKLLNTSIDTISAMFALVDKQIYQRECFWNFNDALKTLSTINEPLIRRSFARGLEEFSKTDYPNYTARKFLPKANRINSVMMRRLVSNYEDGRAWCALNEYGQFIILTFHFFHKGRLTPALALKIVSYISDLPKDQEKVYELANRVNNFFYSDRILKKYSTAFTPFLDKCSPFQIEEEKTTPRP